MLKLARLDDLKRRLTEALAHHPELAAAFERALTRHDEQALGSAFEALQQAPHATRTRVEELIIDWLFGDGGEPPGAPVAVVGNRTRH